MIRYSKEAKEAGWRDVPSMAEYIRSVPNQRHVMKEIARHTMIKQWKVVCSCGHESFDATKKEAMGWHRDHVMEASGKSREQC